MSRLPHKAILIFGIFVALASGALPAAAQTCEGPLGVVRNVKNTTEMTVQLPHSMTDKDFEEGAGPDKWILVDVSKPAVPERPLRVVAVKPDRPDISLPITDLFLTLNRPLDDDHEYRLFAPALTFIPPGLNIGGCRPQAVPEGTVTFKGPAPAGGRVLPPDTDVFKKSPSKGRDDSNVYLSGQLEGANGSSPQISADIKLESPYDTAGFFQELGPYFNLKASTATGSDANSMSFGLKLRHSFPVPVRLNPGTTQVAKKQPLLSGVVWDLTPGFESDRRFDNVNVTVGNRFIFVPRVFGDTNRIYLQPFVGFEVGRNLKSPVDEAEGRAIARSTTGASLYLNLMPKADKPLTFQVDYIRRFLLRREVSFEEDDDKKLVALSVGRGPRDHVKAAFEYGFSDFLGMTLSYEYGRLPPNFQLVDHKYGLGLTYKFKTKFPK